MKSELQKLQEAKEQGKWADCMKAVLELAQLVETTRQLLEQTRLRLNRIEQFLDIDREIKTNQEPNGDGKTLQNLAAYRGNK